MSGYRRRDRLGVSPRQTIERALNLKDAAVILQDLGESADLARVGQPRGKRRRQAHDQFERV